MVALIVKFFDKYFSSNFLKAFTVIEVGFVDFFVVSLSFICIKYVYPFPDVIIF